MNDDQTWLELKAIHTEHLATYGVELPREGSNKQLQLIVLYEAYKHSPQQFIHKDAISIAIRKINPQAATDQQVRHLRAKGWNIENDGKGNHRFIDPTRPSPEIARQAVKRSSLLSATDFEGIKAAHNNRCITCGSQEGESNWRYGDTPIKLQKGHKDPRKSEAQGNIIPQCQFCNQAYKSDFTFDDKGRVRAVAGIGAVKRATKAVQKEVWEFLKTKFGSTS